MLMAKNDRSYKLWEKEIKLLQKLHSDKDHIKEQEILKSVKEVEWVKVPTDAQIRGEIKRLKKIEQEAAQLLAPEPRAYPHLPRMRKEIKSELNIVTKRRKIKKKSKK